MDARDAIRVARVLHEDPDYITLTVAKSNDRVVELQEGDRFLTVLFMHQEGDRAVPWLPWEV